MKAKLLAHKKELNPDGHISELKAWIVPIGEHTPHGLKYSVVYIKMARGLLVMTTNGAKGTIGIMQE